MSGETENLFSIIFCDAQVIDLDFSEWDKQIRLCVVGLDVAYPSENLPLFVVEFKRVAELNFTFNHLDIELEKKHHHFQWNIHDFRKKNVGGALQIELIGSGASPNIKIICESYDIRPLQRSMLDSLFPQWDEPFGPLARPGIEAMFRIVEESKGVNSKGSNL